MEPDKQSSIAPTWPETVLCTLLLPLTIPLLLIVLALSIPATHINRYLTRLREAKLRTKLQSAARLIFWPEARQRLQEGGTLIMEYLSGKGPVRHWFTLEDIAATSPYPCCFEQHPWFEDDWPLFFDWCRHRFTHPVSGSAQLLIRDESEIAEYVTLLTQLRAHKRCVCVGPHSLNNRSGLPITA